MTNIKEIDDYIGGCLAKFVEGNGDLSDPRFTNIEKLQPDDDAITELQKRASLLGEIEPGSDFLDILPWAMLPEEEDIKKLGSRWFPLEDGEDRFIDECIRWAVVTSDTRIGTTGRVRGARTIRIRNFVSRMADVYFPEINEDVIDARFKSLVELGHIVSLPHGVYTPNHTAIDVGDGKMLLITGWPVRWIEQKDPECPVTFEKEQSWVRNWNGRKQSLLDWITPPPLVRWANGDPNKFLDKIVEMTLNRPVDENAMEHKNSPPLVHPNLAWAKLTSVGLDSFIFKHGSHEFYLTKGTKQNDGSWSPARFILKKGAQYKVMDLHDAIWKSIFLAYQKTRGESWSIEKLAKSEIRLTRALHRMETLGLDSTKNVSINNCKRLSFVEV